MPAIVEVNLTGIDRFGDSIVNLNLAIREAVNALGDVRIVIGSNSAGVPLLTRNEAEAFVLKALRGEE